MRFNNCTIGFVKSIYLKKLIATENNDQIALANLKNEYPEIFNAKFMMDVLKNELERQKNDLSDNMLFKLSLFQYQ